MSGVIIETAPAEPAAVDTDALVVLSFSDRLGDVATVIDGHLDGALSGLRQRGAVKGGFGERTVVLTLGRLPTQLVLLLGLGELRDLDSFRLLNALRMAGNELRHQGVRSVTVAVDPALAAVLAAQDATGINRPLLLDEQPSDGGEAAQVVARSILTGLLLANHDEALHASKPEPQPQLERIALHGTDAAEVAEEVRVLAGATNRVREWAAEPANLLTPTRLAARARELAEGTGLAVEVLERADMERHGMGALLGVARGSDEPPALICLRHDGGEPGGPLLALVGKGITFDTGGISLKPAEGMELMKWDMAGGAAVLAALLAIAALGVPANVVGIVPATENMPGGRAYKPGDVLTAMDGTTIEITNTDAEGRVVLADGLCWAHRLGATHIIDVATLTGAVIVALGHAAAGLMGNHRGLAALVQRAAQQAGDRFVEMPVFPEYSVALKSEVADLKNAAGRQGGALGGAVFLRHFVGDVPWVHLDIAGTVWNSQGDQVQIPKGASGAPVRTLVLLAQLFAQTPPG